MKLLLWIAGIFVVLFVISMLGMGYINMYLVAK